MLRLIDVALARGARTLYRGVSLIARPGERVGLVGANGCGKSTLFAAILGELGLEAGSMEAPPPERIAHVAQDIDVSGQRAIDYVLAGHAPLTAATRPNSPPPRQVTTRCDWRMRTRRWPNSTKGRSSRRPPP